MTPGRVCPHCGKRIASDRKWLCNNCGRDFTKADADGPAAVPARLAVETQDWTLPVAIRTYRNDEQGRGIMASEAQELGRHGYELLGQREDRGPVRLGRLILTGGLAILAGRSRIRSAGRLTVTYRRAESLPRPATSGPEVPGPAAGLEPSATPSPEAAVMGSMAHTSGLRIAAVHNESTGATSVGDEWVQLVNAGTERWERHEWQLVAKDGHQVRGDVFSFPIVLPRVTGGWWSFEPGESIYVFTGPGIDTFVPDPPDGRRPQFHFFWNRDAMAWTHPGDHIELRNSDGLLLAPPFPVP